MQTEPSFHTQCVFLSVQNLTFSTACVNAFGGEDCPFFCTEKAPSSTTTTTIFVCTHIHTCFNQIKKKEKIKKIYLEVRIFGKMLHQIPFLLALRACVRQFQMPLNPLMPKSDL